MPQEDYASTLFNEYLDSPHAIIEGKAKSHPSSLKNIPRKKLSSDLQALKFVNQRLNAEQTRKLIPILENMKSLEILDLSENQFINATAFYDLCRELTSLKHFILNHTTIQNLNPGILPIVLKNNKNLISLHLFKTGTANFSQEYSNFQSLCGYDQKGTEANFLKEIIETFPSLEELNVAIVDASSKAVAGLRKAMENSKQHPLKILTLPLSKEVEPGDLSFIANRLTTLHIPVSNISLETLKLALFQNTTLKDLQVSSYNISLSALETLLHFLKKYNYCLSLIKFSSNTMSTYSKANYPELSFQAWEKKFGKLNEQPQKLQHSFDMLMARNKLLSSLPENFSKYQEDFEDLLQKKMEAENENDNQTAHQVGKQIQALESEVSKAIIGLKSAYYPELVNHILQTNRELGETLLLNFPVALGIVKDYSKFLPGLPIEIKLYILSFVCCSQNPPYEAQDAQNDNSESETGEPSYKRQKTNHEELNAPSNQGDIPFIDNSVPHISLNLSGSMYDFSSDE